MKTFTNSLLLVLIYACFASNFGLADEEACQSIPRGVVSPSPADSEATIPEDAVSYELLICTYTPEKQGESLMPILADAVKKYDKTDTTDGDFVFHYAADNHAVDVLFDVLHKTGKCEILSRPHIMALDKQLAFIFVGSRDENNEKNGLQLMICPEIVEDEQYKTEIQLECKIKSGKKSIYSVSTTLNDNVAFVFGGWQYEPEFDKPAKELIVCLKGKKSSVTKIPTPCLNQTTALSGLKTGVQAME
ncbi:MAG: hypothetical protein ACRC2T_19845, partial [Thermoguttaceae bacterium]